MVFSFSTAFADLCYSVDRKPGWLIGPWESWNLSLLMLGEVDVRPAGGDDLGPGVERHALGTVDVVLPEQGVLPAAERSWTAIGTGIGTFTPIMPTCTPRWKRRAASPLEVKIAVPFP